MKKSWITVQEEDYRDFKSLSGGGDDLYTFLPDFNVSKDKKILEVGCGNGYLLEYLQQHNYTDVTGIDIVERAVRDSKNRCNYPIYHMDAHILTFGDDTFDVVIASHMIEHSPVPRVVLQEIKRVLKPNGLLFIEIPIEPYINDDSGHFSRWDETEFINFILTEFRILKAVRTRWFYIVGVKNGV